MCVVSNVSDWGQRTWPLQPDQGGWALPAVPVNPWASAPNQTLPAPYRPYDGPSRAEWEEFKDLIKKALEIDEKTGQPDCVDPKKKEWFDATDLRVKALED